MSPNSFFLYFYNLIFRIENEELIVKKYFLTERAEGKGRL